MISFYPTLFDIVKVMSRKKYVIFTDSRGFDLNIVGIRTECKEAGSFDDFICVFYRQGREWTFHVFNATTDPGTYWLQNPMNVDGTAVLKEGQYRGSYQIGAHQGKYSALVQKRPVTVYRDCDKDSDIDETSKEDCGFHGVNIHRASEFTASKEVGKWSAGCQVIQCPIQFRLFMDLCYEARAKFGNSFTYTLLNERDFYDGV